MNRLFNTFFDAPTPPAAAPRSVAGFRRWTWSRPTASSSCGPTFPDCPRSDVNIELEDHVLTVSGERKSEHEERNEGYYRVERSSGSFRRSLTLPEGVDPEAVKATLRPRRARGPGAQARGAQAAQGRDQRRL